ncbi:hypothetical protein [Spirobacillus cienkowskii]|jgi:hypothetical protein|uniref:Heme exporter protein D n=1 Tax=Spirobacillus cienkowskii TaxID=495820 RepID=A0A369KU91_9BACT|nr:MAG: hypothetical protein DCC88_10785 [Spirobacillus cienkowskii]
MNSSYGNLSWEFFVYGSYIIVAASLFFYVAITIFKRNKIIKSMQNEGFFENTEANKDNNS